MTIDVKTSVFDAVADSDGRFGAYGGKFVAETLMSALAELEALYRKLSVDPAFQQELDEDLAHYVGRPSPLYEAKRWSASIGGARIFLKREDLNHTGAHKVNNTVGQALLAKHMGKPRVIAETGAGQHGVATATIAARLGLKCQVFMGEEDVRRQALNVYRMKLLGAEVFTTVGTEEKAELAKVAGADHTILYRDVDFTEAIVAIADDRLAVSHAILTSVELADHVPAHG